MSDLVDIDDIILNYDPAAKQARFQSAVFGAEFPELAVALPKEIPWPADALPKAAPLFPPPLPSDDLSRFTGYDAVVVTWTAAEASALAALLSPGVGTSQWYQYCHNVEQYIPLVTGRMAPFNSKQADMARYYRCMALYYPCTIGTSRVLLVKSGLHLDYDGPEIPVRRLMAEIANVVQPKVFITTGTGGGIGPDVKLGDVVIAGTVRFDCRTQFAAQPWAQNSYVRSVLPAGALDAITPALTSVNAARIPGARPTPQIFSAATDAIVTTDFFAFDDSTNHYGLQALGRACDMGDAMVADAVHAIPNMSWFAIRNASDPQIPNLPDNMKEAAQTAAKIYMQYGGLTTAASVIASWAIITSAIAH